MLTVRYTDPAGEQLDEILERSEVDWGHDVRLRYAGLIAQAIIDLAENPHRPGAVRDEGRVLYHLRHSRPNVPKELGRVKDPRHLIAAKVVGDDLVILAVAWDGMVDELERRIREGEDDLSKPASDA